MLRPEQKKKLVGHQIKFDSFPYEIWVDHKKISNSASFTLRGIVVLITRKRHSTT